MPTISFLAAVCSFYSSNSKCTTESIDNLLHIYYRSWNYQLGWWTTKTTFNFDTRSILPVQLSNMCLPIGGSWPDYNLWWYSYDELSSITIIYGKLEMITTNVHTHILNSHTHTPECMHARRHTHSRTHALAHTKRVHIVCTAEVNKIAIQSKTTR